MVRFGQGQPFSVRQEKSCEPDLDSFSGPGRGELQVFRSGLGSAWPPVGEGEPVPRYDHGPGFHTPVPVICAVDSAGSFDQVVDINLRL